MGRTKKVFKWFYIFDLEKEENWLRNMAQKGWIFQKVNILGIYTFIKGQSTDAIYKIDFNNKVEDVEEYYDLFAESGWRFIHKVREFRYFKYSGQITSFDKLVIYNDPSQQFKWLHKWLAFFLLIYGIEFVALYTILFLQGKTNIGAGLEPMIIVLFISILSIILIRFVNSYIALKRKVKEDQAIDYCSKGILKKFSSAISLFIAPIILSAALAVAVTVLSTVGSSEKAIKNKVLQGDEMSLYPMRTINYVISEDIGDFKVSLYGNNNRIGIIALEKLVFNRYKVITNFSSGVRPNHNALSNFLKLGQHDYITIYGNDENQEIDNTVIKYKDGTEDKIATNKIVRKGENFIILIKANRDIEDIKIFDKSNIDISHKYIDFQSKDF